MMLSPATTQVEVEGVDGISGNAIIDYLHRAFVRFLHFTGA